MNDPVMLHDALVASGWLVTLGGVIAVSGCAGQVDRRAQGTAVSLLGVIVAAVAAGDWHGSAWGTAAALVLLVIVGGLLSTSFLSPIARRPFDGERQTGSELPAGGAEFYALALWLSAAALAVTVMWLAS